ncbi:MAG: 2-hydroxyacid dehydrogenase, partial [Mangrovicoccus sp.]
MSDTTLLICTAAFNDEERTRLLDACPAHYVASPDEIADLPEELRAGIKALAFKGHTPLTAAAMDPLPGLGLIANFGVGYDSIDVDAATERGIKVTNTPNVLNDDVADMAVALMLTHAHDVIGGHAWVKAGKWASEGNYPLQRKMTGGTVGIVGLGRIGREIADRLAAFKMEIHYHSRSEKETPGWTYHADPVSLAGAVDWLVVALVGGAETENYVSAQVLEALGPQGVVINIARGSIIDEGALLDALEQDKIAGAGLDVFEHGTEVNPRLRELPNVVLLPHMGSATVEGRIEMGEKVLINIKTFDDGHRPPDL